MRMSPSPLWHQQPVQRPPSTEHQRPKQDLNEEEIRTSGSRWAPFIKRVSEMNHQRGKDHAALDGCRGSALAQLSPPGAASWREWGLDLIAGKPGNAAGIDSGESIRVPCFSQGEAATRRPWPEAHRP